MRLLVVLFVLLAIFGFVAIEAKKGKGGSMHKHSKSRSSKDSSSNSDSSSSSSSSESHSREKKKKHHKKGYKVRYMHRPVYRSVQYAPAPAYNNQPYNYGK
ncbi:hypothetical protein WR25_25794 [Diploscapter pachys]|uniref:Uncharacterized protein n=1 Tax=Diploscapter pachys TaxID=2018661 RepID=A0A2A2JGR6_9BILA|nr:hypothetical protein WR25_25794 [Diploscapter pachys]